jgi:DNA-binding XRE family transcriptional regulator
MTLYPDWDRLSIGILTVFPFFIISPQCVPFDILTQERYNDREGGKAVKKETFGQRLQRLRAEAGLTQQQVSDRANVPLQSLRNWEHDRREPGVSVLFKLADALGVDCRAFKDCVDAAAEPAPATKGKKGKGKG